MKPRVSVVIPTLNEEVDIGACLEALGGQTVGAPALQVIVSDGGSTDRTVEAAETVAQRLGFAEFVVVHNPARRTSAGLNKALDAARGDYVVRIDARSRVEPHYVERTVAVLESDSSVGVVGGAQVAVARDDRVVSRGIARALRNRYSTGLSRYRTANRSGPADTVWMGVFRREDLVEMGGWDVTIALNEDFDLNERFRRRGKVVWFDASLRSEYVPRSDLRLLARQYFRFGRVKGLWWARGRRPNLRQRFLLLMPAFVTALAGGVWRRRGLPTAAVTGLLVLVVADHVGSEEGADIAKRVVSSTAIAVYCSSWVCGVAIGFVGERLGWRYELG